MYPFDNHTKHDATSNSDKAGNLPKVAIVEHFLAVAVQCPVVSLARVVLVPWYLKMIRINLTENRIKASATSLGES